MNVFDCDLHIHSISSGHAFNTIDEYAKFAYSNNYKLIGISDHGPSMEGAPHMGYFEMMYRLPHINQGIKMLYGCEANILSENGNVDISGSVLSELDYTMAGLHKKTPYIDKGAKENTTAIVNTIRSGKIDIITHPVSWNFSVNITAIVEAALENNVLLEANKTILVGAVEHNKKDVIKNYSDLLSLSQEVGVGIIWGSDAHHIYEMEISSLKIQMISEIYNYDFTQTINHRLDDLLDYLNKRKSIR